MRKISRVKALPAYRLELEFDDGVRGTVDLSDLKRSAKVYLLYGATRSSSSRFVSVHPVN
jgi:hypothetical protein